MEFYQYIGFIYRVYIYKFTERDRVFLLKIIDPESILNFKKTLTTFELFIIEVSDNLGYVRLPCTIKIAHTCRSMVKVIQN